MHGFGRVADPQALAELARAFRAAEASDRAATEPNGLTATRPALSPASPSGNAEAAPARPLDAPRRPGRVDAVLDKASAFVGEFERTFAAVIWHETYLREERTRQQFRSSGTRFTGDRAPADGVGTPVSCGCRLRRPGLRFAT
jgi:hypothetical protein